MSRDLPTLRLNIFPFPFLSTALPYLYYQRTRKVRREGIEGQEGMEVTMD